MYNQSHWTSKIFAPGKDHRNGNDCPQGSQEARPYLSYTATSTGSSSQIDSQNSVPRYEDILATTRYREMMEKIMSIQSSVEDICRSMKAMETMLLNEVRQVQEHSSLQLKQLNDEVRFLINGLEQVKASKSFLNVDIPHSSSEKAKRMRSSLNSDDESDHGLCLNEFLRKRRKSDPGKKLQPDSVGERLDDSEDELFSSS